MVDAASKLYDNFSSFADLEGLITDAEPEGLYIECKAPSEPRLTRELKNHLATAVSGFANTAGGLVIYGLSTTKHSHSGLDVITAIEPLGQCRRFQQQVVAAIPTLVSPPVLNFQTKVITEKPKESRGVVLVHIPLTSGDPIQSNLDNVFYFRSGDEFRPAPHEMVKRLFAGGQIPDVYPIFNSDLIKLLPDGSWSIPIILTNRSSATARDVRIFLRIFNPSACEVITPPESFKDASAINPGKRVYSLDLDSVLHRGFNMILGEFRVKMKVGKRPKRRLDLGFNIFADKMRARKVEFTLQLAKKGFSLTKRSEGYIY